MFKFLLGVVLLAIVAVQGDGDSCYSYAGGSVYPSYARGAHDLHSTKAFSKLISVNLSATSTNPNWFQSPGQPLRSTARPWSMGNSCSSL